jgi:anti-sigma factor RsiW
VQRSPIPVELRTTKMACNPEEILRYVDGDLSPDESARVRAHARSCESCREMLETVVALENALGGLRELEPPPDFAAQTVSRARNDVVHAARSPHERRRVVAVGASLASVSLVLLWPSGIAGSLVDYVGPARCLGRFFLSWAGNWALSVFIVTRTLSRDLLDEASLTVGAAIFLLVGLLALLGWLLAGYRKYGAVGAGDNER